MGKGYATLQLIKNLQVVDRIFYAGPAAHSNSYPQEMYSAKDRASPSGEKSALQPNFLYDVCGLDGHNRLTVEAMH